jgi:hypothetical protein
MRAYFAGLTLALLTVPATAQTPAQPPAQPQTATAPALADSATAPVPLTAAQDHQRLLNLLGIKELRPGVSHDGTGPNPVNYDESKANPWPKLPDPLVLSNGKPVTTDKLWWAKRRPELVELFDREIVGRVPENVPSVRWEVVSSTDGEDGGIATVTRRLIAHVDNSAYPAITVNIEASLTLPAEALRPIPVVLEITFENYPRNPNRPDAPTPPEPHPTWKQQVLSRGWGYALLYPTTVQADNGAGLTQGIIGLANHGRPRDLDDWGALRAWAWGASRLMDYFESNGDVDTHHVAITGHSRFGKTALVAMAYDPRFAVAYISSSGAGGADLARRHYGEQLENIAAPGEYHWMAGNYLKYAGPLTPADMPVDSHELIALCAPRPVFIGGGTSEGADGWADTHGTFLSEVGAGPVYRLLGVRDLGTTEFPPVGTALISGSLAFREHPGGHTPLPNFPAFLDFAARYITPAKHPNAR